MPKPVDAPLDDWQASYHPAFEGVRVVGHRRSPTAMEIRDFPGRNFVTAGLDAETWFKALLPVTSLS